MMGLKLQALCHFYSNILTKHLWLTNVLLAVFYKCEFTRFFVNTI